MNLLFLDTETNGLPRSWDVDPIQHPENWPRAVQIAWEWGDETNWVGMDSRVIKPDGWTIPDEVAAMNGITTERAEREGLRIYDVLSDLAVLIDECDRVVCHNVSFDRSVLVAELSRQLGWDKEPARELWRRPWYCTMRTTTDLVRIRGPYGNKWPRLEELHKFLFGVASEFQAHDAGGDVSTLAKCYRELVKRGLVQ